MKTNTQLALAGLILSLFSWQACKKYPEDDKRSFKTPKARIEGVWWCTSYKLNGQERLDKWTYGADFQTIYCNFSNHSWPKSQSSIDDIIYTIKENGDISRQTVIATQTLNSFTSEYYCSARYDWAGTSYIGQEGKYEFAEKKKKLKIQDNSGSTSEYTILRLDKTHLHIKLEDGTGSYDLTFEKD